MADQTLIQYIKQNLQAGFSEAEIRQALLEAGWTETEAAEGFREKNFWSKYRKAFFPVLITLVSLPIVGFGGFWIYQKISLEASKERVAGGVTTRPSPEDATVKRDQQRLIDIQNLQASLQDYFVKHKFYPRSLRELNLAPQDPKDQEPYLYTPFGNPPLHYSLTFILETEIGGLRAGLQIVSSEVLLSPKPQASPSSTEQAFQITDLSRLPFYPHEEVILEVTTPQSLALQTVYLAISPLGLELTDRTPPFRFKFTAPQIPGRYEVKVTGFDESGKSYEAHTTLQVELSKRG